jgi:hypothetical protein
VLAEFALPVDRQETRTDLYQIFESLTHEGDSRISSGLILPGKQFSEGFSEGFAMAAPIPLRPDFDAALRRRLARQSRDPGQTRRCLARAEIYRGLAHGDVRPGTSGWWRSAGSSRDIHVAALTMAD